MYLIELAPSGSSRRSIDSKKNKRLGTKVLQHAHALCRKPIRPRVWLGATAPAAARAVQKTRRDALPRRNVLNAVAGAQVSEDLSQKVVGRTLVCGVHFAMRVSEW